MAWKRSWAPGGVGGGMGEAFASPVPVGLPEVELAVCVGFGGSTVLGGGVLGCAAS